MIIFGVMVMLMIMVMSMIMVIDQWPGASVQSFRETMEPLGRSREWSKVFVIAFAFAFVIVIIDGMIFKSIQGVFSVI